MMIISAELLLKTKAAQTALYLEEPIRTNQSMAPDIEAQKENMISIANAMTAVRCDVSDHTFRFFLLDT